MFLPYKNEVDFFHSWFVNAYSKIGSERLYGGHCLIFMTLTTKLCLAYTLSVLF